jgi:FkbM family methyltransferase
MSQGFGNNLSQIIRNSVAGWIFSFLDSHLLPTSIELCILNFSQFLRGLPTRFRVNVNKNIYEAFEDSGAKRIQVFGSNLRRIFQLYLYGIEKRHNSLANSYFLEQISFSDGDVVLDCGANWGDLYGYLEKKAIDYRYIAFEPNPADYLALMMNCPKGEVHQIALGDRDGHFRFFLNSADGDSSLIEPSTGFSESVQIPVRRLDHLLDSIESVKLLKVEAEGFEPEVIAGAAENIRKVKFIAIDGGPERGRNQDTTLETVLNSLVGRGFKILKIDLVSGMGRALLVNENR